MELIKRLKNRYGCNEPITTEEVLKTWSEYSRPRVFQLLKKFADEKVILKFESGIYYIPTETIFGLSKLSSRKVIEKKYIQSENVVYGFYGGMSLLNTLQLTTQVPNDLEIFSDKAPAVVRNIKIGVTKVKIRKTRFPVCNENVYVLMLLEAFNQKGSIISIEELEGIKNFIQEKGIKEKDVFKYAPYFPAKAIKNLISTGVENVFA